MRRDQEHRGGNQGAGADDVGTRTSPVIGHHRPDIRVQCPIRLPLRDPMRRGHAHDR